MDSIHEAGNSKAIKKKSSKIFGTGFFTPKAKLIFAM